MNPWRWQSARPRSSNGKRGRGVSGSLGKAGNDRPTGVRAHPGRAETPSCLNIIPQKAGSEDLGPVMHTMGPKSHVAYVAGFFDGEGCIYRNSARPDTFYLEIVNTDKTVLEAIQHVIGGHIRKRVGQRLGKKQQWRLGVYDQRLVRVTLRRLLPYLLVKKDLAQNVLAKSDPGGQ